MKQIYSKLSFVLSLFLLLFAQNVWAARLTLNQNGAETIYMLDSASRLSFDDAWTKLYIEYGGTEKDTINLQYINRITLDTLGGALSDFYINTESGSEQVDFTKVERIFFELGEPDLEADSDADGLSDYDEKYRYGTNPMNENTDGDLYDDYEEVHHFGDFWPLVAELPEMSVRMTSYPEVTLNYTYTSDQTTATEVISASETSVSQTDSRTSEVCQSHEHGWELAFGMDQQVGYGVDAGVKWTWNWQAGAHGTYGHSETVSTGTENSREYSQSVERAEARELSEGISYENGTLEVQFEVENAGDLAFDFNTLNFNLVLEDRGEYSIISDLATSISVINPVSLNPGNSISVTASLDLDLESAKEIRAQIAAADKMYGVLGSYNISYNGASVNEAYTQSWSNCATVIVDFGGNIEPIRRQVSALVNYNPHGTLDYSPLVLKEALEILQRELKGKTGLGKDLWWQYGQIDGRMGLWAMGIDEDSVFTRDQDNAYWYIIHQRDAADEVHGYSLKTNSIFLDTIPIGFKDYIHLVYSKDSDDDSLSQYEEALYGTSDTDRDSDDDGLSDYEEVRGFQRVVNGDTLIWQTNPMMPDTDGDGENDAVDENPLRRPGEVLSDSTALDSLVFVDGLGDSLVLTELRNVNDTIEITTAAGQTNFAIYAISDEVVSKIDIEQVGMPNLITEQSTTSLLKWESSFVIDHVRNDLRIIITSESGAAKDTLYVHQTAPLANDAAIDSLGYDQQKPWRIINLLLDNAEQTDPRTTGVLLMRSRDSVVLADFSLEAGNNDDHVIGSYFNEGTTYGVYLIRDGEVSQSSEAFVDDSGVHPGRQYFYRQIPYFTDSEGKHWYAEGGSIVNETLLRVRARIHFSSYEIIQEGDGIGGADIGHSLRRCVKDSDGESCLTVSSGLQNGLGDGEIIYPSEDSDYEVFPDLEDSLKVQLKLWEEDTAGDDYLWGSSSSWTANNGTIFPELVDDGYYGLEYLGDIAVNGGAAGWSRVDNSAYIFNGAYYENSYSATQEASNTRVAVVLKIHVAIVQPE
jgi:hypothetical protein